MRTWLMAGVYLAPVAAFTAIASVSGYSEQMVEYSDFEDHTVFAELFDFDDQRSSLATVVPTPSFSPVSDEEEQTEARKIVPPQNLDVFWLASEGAKPSLFNDLTLEAIVADFEAVVDATDASNDFLITADAGASGLTRSVLKQSAKGYAKNSAASNIAASTAAGLAARSFGGSSFGNSAQSGLATASTSALSSVGGIGTQTAAAGTAGTPGAQPAAGTTAALAPVPLPAGAPLLVVALAGLGFLRSRKAR